MTRWDVPEVGVDFETLKDVVQIRDVMEFYGIDIPHDAGTKWRAPCPIHKGTNDTAFSVDEGNNRWFCFNCGEGGSVIDFIRLLKGLSLSAAAELLSKDLELGNLGSVSRDMKVHRATNRKVKAWQDWKKPPPALGDEDVPDTIDLEEGYRGLSRSTIDAFGLRRVPGNGWGTGIYIPFRSDKGTLLGYAIRQHEGLKPKYLNSEGLPKGGFLFGLHENLDGVLNGDSCVITEGQFDTISLAQKGIRNAVALMGDQLSPQQAGILQHYASSLVLLLDGDDAGLAASVKISKNWCHAFDIVIRRPPIGKDPDELTTEELKELLDV